MAWLVSILMLLIIISLILALKFLVFKSGETATNGKAPSKKVVNLLTLRILFTAILLALSYLHLSSI